MKKIVLIIAMMFSSVSLLNATTITDTNRKNENPKSKEKIEKITPSSCWTLADAIETQHCGSVGCDFDLWEEKYNECMSLIK